MKTPHCKRHEDFDPICAICILIGRLVKSNTLMIRSWPKLKAHVRKAEREGRLAKLPKWRANR